jgi:Fungal Zn(2)-Cys(6) binuclear cluster domain
MPTSNPAKIQFHAPSASPILIGANVLPRPTPVCSQPKKLANPSRKRNFSHKTRSGCDTCKTRHIKCDETRPVCIRCQKAGFTCNYNVPKAWIFEGTSHPATSDARSSNVRQKNDTTPAEDVYPAVSDLCFTPEEKRSIAYWVANTGPFLGKYAGQARAMWEVVLPRCAQQLPATKHLLVAVAMLDERLSNSSSQPLEERTRRILNRYQSALKCLVAKDTIQLDVLLSSMVAWVLEIMKDDAQRAKMHLDASGRLLQKAIANSPHDVHSEEQDIIHRHMTVAHQQCVGYAKTEPRQDDEPHHDAASLVPTPISKHDPHFITSIVQLKQIIKEYFQQLSLAQETGFTISQARQHRRSYEIALLEYRHVASEPDINIIAVHLWLNLTNHLLPGTEDANITSCHDVSGMDYVLDRVQDLHMTKGLKPEHREDLEETLNLILINVMRFAKQEKHHIRARNLMRVLGSSE